MLKASVSYLSTRRNDFSGGKPTLSGFETRISSYIVRLDILNNF